MNQPPEIIAELKNELAALPPDADQRSVAILECRIASAQLELHDYDAAINGFSTAIGRMDPNSEAVLLGNAYTDLGRCYYGQARYQEAHVHFTKALAYLQDAGSGEVIANCLHNLGNTLYILGDYDSSLERYHEARQRFLDAGRPDRASAPLSGMAKVHHNLGNFEEAVSLGLESFEAHKLSGFKRGQADALIALARVHATMGDHEAALQYFDSCLDLYEELHEVRLAAISRVGRAESLVLLQRLEEALPELMAARACYVPEVDNELFVEVTGDIANVLIGLDRLDDAQAEIDRMDGVPVQRVNSIVKREFMRSSLLSALGDRDGAARATELARQSAESSGDQHLILNVLGQRRQLAREAGDLGSYVSLNDQYTELSERIKGAQVQRSVHARSKQHELTKHAAAAEQYRSLLYSTLPKDVADRIIRGEDVSGDHVDNAAVIFLDIAGFTTASSQFEPSAVTGLLATIFSEFDALCARHGVTKIKTIGDSYMAVAFPETGERESESGDQKADNGMAQRAAELALEMINAEFYWPSATADSNSNRVLFRIGIHSGPVVAGVIGTDRLQYDVWGDTVNVASRMESTGEPGKIQVSSPFATALRDGQRISDIGEDGPISDPRYPILRERGTVEVKGKGTMTTYWLERA